jgi:glutamate carboxypeptidase
MKSSPAEVTDEILARTEDILRDLCAISSESGNSRGIREVAERLGAELSRNGLTVEVTDQIDANGAPQPVLFARTASAGRPHLLLLGHMDTVLPAVEPRVEGRTLFATGALDMKGGLAMLIGALDLLASRGEAPPTDMLVVLVPDEESESLISGDAANRWSRDARAVLVLEPGMATAGGETLVAGRRGLTEWKLDVKGRASHSGLAYWSGRSAAAAAASWSARAQALSKKGSAPTVNIGRIVGGGEDFVTRLGEHHGMLGSSRQLNVVSDRAVAEGEVRFLTEADSVAILGQLRGLAEEIAGEHEVEMTFTAGMHIAPVDPDGPGASLVQRTVDIAAKRQFHLEVEQDRGGVSFPNFIADPAKTPVIDGLGPTGDGMHIRGEFLSLDSLNRRILLLADLLPTL